jgi:hypothetical protein
MAIQTFGSDVIVVRVPTRFRVADHGVAIRIPLIPVVPRRRFANLVLLVGARTLNRDELPLTHARSALRSSNFNFAFADEHFSVVVGRNQNSEARFAPLGANGYVWRIDFRVRIAAAVHGVVRHAVPKLNLNLRTRQLHDVRLCVFRQAKRIRVIEFKFGARFVAGRNTVPREHGSVQHRSRPILRIATLRGNIAMNQADARDAVILNRGRGVITRTAAA